jgi:hypothetical protein
VKGRLLHIGGGVYQRYAQNAILGSITRQFRHHLLTEEFPKLFAQPVYSETLSRREEELNDRLGGDLPHPRNNSCPPSYVGIGSEASPLVVFSSARNLPLRALRLAGTKFCRSSAAGSGRHLLVQRHSCNNETLQAPLHRLAGRKRGGAGVPRESSRRSGLISHDAAPLPD